MDMRLEPRAAAVLDALRGAGYKAYAVGGCVRDSLLGQTVHDWDACTSASPEQVIALFGEKSCIPTGIKHGTVTVRMRGESVEVTTFRTEGAYSDGRHPDEVAFVGDVREDLARRDFTVNAMAYNAEEGLIDPFGGRDDLARGMLRAVGDPARRFGEDALRILRLFRFGAKLGFALEGETKRAALARVQTLSRVSAERIWAELAKLLCSPKPAAYLPEALLRVCLPEAAAGDAHALMRRIRAVDASEPVLEVRLAVLLCGAGEQGAREALKKLKSPNAVADAVALLVRERDLHEETDKKALRVQARRCLGRMTLADMMRLKMLRDAELAAGVRGKEDGDLSALLAQAQRFAQCGECCSVRQLDVKGQELRAATGASGPQLGRLLEWLLECVVREDVPNEKHALLSAAQRRMEENG